MKREEVQNGITAGLPEAEHGPIEDRICELLRPARDATGVGDQITAARRAVDELLDQLCQQLTDYRLLTEALQDVWQEVKKERAAMRRQLADCEQKITQLEAELNRAKREREVMRAKLDQWCQALNREQPSALK
jgi:phage shock protein A